MIVYLTSKNSGPSWHSDPVYVVYLGLSETDATAAVESFKKYKMDEKFWPSFKDPYVALPTRVLEELQPEMIAFYAADGWWYSVVKFDLEES